ncbi:MAG: DUF554 domain-containing protein [Bacillota bacterium]|nr:DUF554 domain-containing protein [Bacillota bacterium]
MGTLINMAAVAAGSLLGLAVRGRLPERMSQTIIQGVGLVTILLGLQMAGKAGNVLLVMFSLAIGGALGEWLNLEAKLEQVGRRLQERFGQGGSSFTQGFVASSLLFCVGPMAIIGSLQDGLNGNYQILMNKSVLDGVSSIALSASLGYGVAFSTLSILVYQGGITLLAGFLKPLLTEVAVQELTATGGLLILAIGLNLVGAARLRVANLLPALVAVLALLSLWP